MAEHPRSGSSLGGLERSQPRFGGAALADSGATSTTGTTAVTAFFRSWIEARIAGGTDPRLMLAAFIDRRSATTMRTHHGKVRCTNEAPCLLLALWAGGRRSALGNAPQEDKVLSAGTAFEGVNRHGFDGKSFVLTR